MTSKINASTGELQYRNGRLAATTCKQVEEIYDSNLADQTIHHTHDSIVVDYRCWFRNLAETSWVIGQEYLGLRSDNFAVMWPLFNYLVGSLFLRSVETLLSFSSSTNSDEM